MEKKAEQAFITLRFLVVGVMSPASSRWRCLDVPDKMDCTLELWAETNTFALELLLLEYLITATGKETKAVTFGSKVVGMPTHGKARHEEA